MRESHDHIPASRAGNLPPHTLVPWPGGAAELRRPVPPDRLIGPG